MTSESKIAAIETAELLGDPHPLLDQLGPADGLATLDSAPAALQFARVRDLPSLRTFLRIYQNEILLPLEWPSILKAHGHASRFEPRELIALDGQLASEPALRDFAVASCRVGQRQLSKLRPLRDERFIKRYLSAIESGQARGWHTLVYGISLAIYSLPLRQGLLAYAERTLGGFIESAAGPLRLTETDCEGLLAEVCGELPGAMELLLASATGPGLCIV